MNDFLFYFSSIVILLFSISLAVLFINAIVWFLSQIPRRIGNDIAKDMVYMYGMEEGGRLVRNWIKVKDLDVKN
jgi:hypothetical protein